VTERIIVDASAIGELLASPNPPPELRRRFAFSRPCAPSVIYPEVLNALRKGLRAGRLAADDVEVMVRDLRDLPITTTSHHPLVRRMWELRNSITPYDAAYVALAEQLDVPLITCDGKLARSHGHSAKIELYPMS
jgi:predicted nucleic acid-binding protein